MGWMKIELTKADVAAGAHIAIQGECQRLFKNAGLPREAALFSRSKIMEAAISGDFDDVDDSDDAAFLTLYFTPAASTLAAMLIEKRAVPTESPRRAALFVGDQSAFQIFGITPGV